MFQIEKVLTGYPASYGGMKVHDFLVSVNGQEVFEMNHGQLVKLIKSSGNTMQLAVERCLLEYIRLKSLALKTCLSGGQFHIIEIMTKQF